MDSGQLNQRDCNCWDGSVLAEYANKSKAVLQYVQILTQDTSVLAV